MDRELQKIISEKVYRRFPEVKGKSPSIRCLVSGQYLLIYTAKDVTADGRPIPRTIRVVAKENGTIVKITSSK